MSKLINALLLVILVMLIGCKEVAEQPIAKLEWRPFESIQAGFPRATKPLFLYIRQHDCDHCTNMELIFKRPEIARYINKHFTPVKIDIYADMPITVQDSILTEFEFRGLLSISGVPAYYFFSTDGRIIGVLDSEMALDGFKRMLVFIKGGHFFRTPYKQFLELPEASDEAIDAEF